MLEFYFAQFMLFLFLSFVILISCSDDERHCEIFEILDYKAIFYDMLSSDFRKGWSILFFILSLFVIVPINLFFFLNRAPFIIIWYSIVNPDTKKIFIKEIK